eukprot:gene23105-30304_t
MAEAHSSTLGPQGSLDEEMGKEGICTDIWFGQPQGFSSGAPPSPTPPSPELGALKPPAVTAPMQGMVAPSVQSQPPTSLFQSLLNPIQRFGGGLMGQAAPAQHVPPSQGTTLDPASSVLSPMQPSSRMASLEVGNWVYPSHTVIPSDDLATSKAVQAAEDAARLESLRVRIGLAPVPRSHKRGFNSRPLTMPPRERVQFAAIYKAPRREGSLPGPRRF